MVYIESICDIFTAYSRPPNSNFWCFMHYVIFLDSVRLLHRNVDENVDEEKDLIN